MRLAQPHITLSAERVKTGDSLILTGMDFTPNRLATSHLLAPDGMEYNPLRLRINERGEISHRIDSTMLEPGVFEVWVDDDTSGRGSNRLSFTHTTPFLI
jgi:hypothetical protein